MSFHRRTFSCLIIDCDGTLVDTKEDIWLCLNEALSLEGIPPVSLEQISAHVGFGITPLIEDHAGAQKTTRVLELFAPIYLQHATRRSKLFPGWSELFAERASAHMFILSNKPQQYLDVIVRNLHLADQFNAWYGREAFPEMKPSGLPVTSILTAYGISQEQALIVGDTIADIGAGKAANIATCGVRYGYQDPEELREMQCDILIDSPLDLLPLIER